MLAALLTGHGDTDRLVVTEAPTPKPGPGEVLIRLGGSAVNNTDINLRVGWYSKAVAGATADATGSSSAAADAGWAGDTLVFPRIQGADGAGHIAAVGAGVPEHRVGERVLIDPILRDGPTTLYFGSDTPGAFADYTVVPAANAAPIRSSLSDPELATFPCSYLAALHMVHRAGVCAGQRVLVTGASGGVGTAAVQWCRARGATVIAIAETSKQAALANLGATQVIARDARLIDHLEPGSVDAVIDVVGGAGFGERLEMLVPHGHYATAGAIAGPLVELDLRTLYLKDLTLHGCTIPPLPLFAELVRSIEDGILQPVVAATFALRDLAEAQKAFLRKQHLGKIAIRIN
jgi:NADPH:quinone reductase-like Zn-dependent oxidoreductase